MLGLSIFLFVAFLMLFLGGIVFVHDPKSRISRLFLMFVIYCVSWMIFNYLENVPLFSLETRAWFLRADFASAIIGASCILLFVMNFIDKDVSRRKQFVFFMPAAILAVVSFSSFLLTRIFTASTGEIRFDQGVAFYYYAPAIILYFVTPCVMLLRERHRALKPQRAQLTPVAIGLIATTIVTLTINLFLQDVLSADVFRIGIYAMLFFIAGVAWSIVRHKFLHIRFVVVEILLLGILTTLLARTILSKDIGEAAINLVSFIILLILGFAMIRSFLNEAQQKLELQVLTSQLEASNQTLRELDELKTTMVSIASHQIRGPLGGIRGYLTMFQEGDLGPVTDKQKDILGLNLNVLSRLLNAVETFLDITKLQSGKMNFMPDTVDLDELIVGISKEFDVPMQKKGLAFSYACKAAKPVMVKVDPEKLKHVVFNLIDNALKYTEQGSIGVQLDTDGKEAIISVFDTGMGVPADDLPKLFGKFQRGKLVVDRGGSGLGLYVVKMLTEMQGGRVWVTSPGVKRGTTFSVALPLTSHP